MRNIFVIQSQRMNDSMTQHLNNDDPNEDRGHLGELERFHPDSFGWAMCCCGHDRTEVEDVLQAAYLKVLEGRARYDGKSAFKTWMFGVIRNTAYDWRRRAWRRLRRLVPLAGAEEQHAPEAECEADDEAVETLAELSRAMTALAPRQREVLHLVFYQELSLSEAASLMGVSVGTARRHYERGKARLRLLLKQKQSNNE